MDGKRQTEEVSLCECVYCVCDSLVAHETLPGQEKMGKRGMGGPQPCKDQTEKENATIR